MHIPVPSCGGRGHIDVDLSFLFGAGTFQSVCPECGGSGKVVADPCPDCGGSGRTRVTSEQTIEFPAGTHDGDEVRISGMGHAGTNGAAGATWSVAPMLRPSAWKAKLVPVFT